MSIIPNDNLAEYVRARNTTVLRGTQNGGKLYPIRGFPAGTDPRGANAPFPFIEDYRNPFFLTLTRFEQNDPNVYLYLYELDELDPDDGRWYKQPGIAHIVGQNEIAINESDGAQGVLALTTDENGQITIILYRYRTGESSFIQHADNVKPVCLKLRDQTINGNQKKSHQKKSHQKKNYQAKNY